MRVDCDTSDPQPDTGIINHLLWNYCRQARIRIPRSWSCRKNDNAWEPTDKL
jgi:hypothetical protein